MQDCFGSDEDVLSVDAESEFGHDLTVTVANDSSVTTPSSQASHLQVTVTNQESSRCAVQPVNTSEQATPDGAPIVSSCTLVPPEKPKKHEYRIPRKIIELPIQPQVDRTSPYAALFARDEKRKAKRRSKAESTAQKAIEASKQRQLSKDCEASQARQLQREREANRKARIEAQRASRETVEARRRDIEREHAVNRRRQEREAQNRLEACEQAIQKLTGDIEATYQANFVRKISIDQYRESKNFECRRPGHTDNLRDFANTAVSTNRVPQRQQPSQCSSVTEYVPQPITLEQKKRISHLVHANRAERNRAPAAITETHHPRRLTAHERLGEREGVRRSPRSATVLHVPAEGLSAEDSGQLPRQISSVTHYREIPPRPEAIQRQRHTQEIATPHIQNNIIAPEQVILSRTEYDRLRAQKTANNRIKNQRRKRLGHAQRTRLAGAIERKLRLELGIEKATVQPKQKED